MFQGRNNSLRHRASRELTRLRGNHPDRLPDFMVVGATRCGTTTLNRLLGSHPEIFVPPRKELHYFNNDAIYRPDLKGYMTLFGGYRNERFVGEVTPSYWEKGAIYNSAGRIESNIRHDAIVRIAQAIPSIRLIISLRDPVERMKSIYIKNFNQGKISHSLEEEVRLEKIGRGKLRLLERSSYHIYINHILEHFPRESINILIFEEWTRGNTSSIQDLFRFIGASPDASLMPVLSNEAGRYRKLLDERRPDASLSTESRRYLIEATAESRNYLERLLEAALPWAKK